ncbi:MAG: thioredoxin domain-containing protein [Planctomycetia bacterium]
MAPCLLAVAAVVGLGGFADPAVADPAAVAAGDVVLLDFSAAWCGPCRQMAPLIGEITAAGWLVRHVDVDREGDLVRRFGVTGVPCYVLLVKGNEVGRINGATTRDELENLLAKSRQPLGLTPAQASAPASNPPAAGIPLPVAAAGAPLSTEPPARPLASAPATVSTPAGLPPRTPEQPVSPRKQRNPDRPVAPATAAAPLDPARRAALERRLFAATARLLVEDSQGVSRGTGTVIDCRQGEALTSARSRLRSQATT